jgi:hypothetical protein
MSMNVPRNPSELASAMTNSHRPSTGGSTHVGAEPALDPHARRNLVVTKEVEQRLDLVETPRAPPVPPRLLRGFALDPDGHNVEAVSTTPRPA